MHRSPDNASLSATISRQMQPWWLAGGALLLAVAFVIAPATVAGGDYGSGFLGGSGLPNAVRDSFIRYWQAGDSSLQADMGNLVDYWLRFHIVKAVIAGLLAAVLMVLTVRLWKRFIDADPATGTRRAFGTTSAITATLSAGAVVLVVANIQGAIAPFSSLLSMLPSAGHDAALGQSTGQVAADLRAGASSPALDGMVHDFAVYHAALAVTAVVLTTITLTFGALMLRSSIATAREYGHNRRARLGAAIGFGLVGAALLVLAVANTGNALNPGNALLLFYTGN